MCIHGAAQDENTRYVCIGPVNKVINMLCCWFEDPGSDAFKRCGPEPCQLTVIASSLSDIFQCKKSPIPYIRSSTLPPKPLPCKCTCSLTF